MQRLLPLLCLLFAFAVPAQETPPAAQSSGLPRVRFETTMGSFVVELEEKRAPLTVASFLKYVKDGHYDGTIFSRVVENFIAQGGGYTPDMKAKPTREAIVNESGNGLTNMRGTIAMARTEEPHSATCQFFINLMDNDNLNPLPTRWGYTVFGRVVEGMEVLENIGHVATGAGGPFTENVPVKPILIQKAQIL